MVKVILWMGEKNLDEVGQEEGGGRVGRWAGEGGGREIRMRVLVSRKGFGERRGVLRRDKVSAAFQWACFGLYVYPMLL